MEVMLIGTLYNSSAATWTRDIIVYSIKLPVALDPYGKIYQALNKQCINVSDLMSNVIARYTDSFSHTSINGILREMAIPKIPSAMHFFDFTFS